MEHSIPVIAGSVSTAMFAASMIPMALKPLITRDLRSYIRSSLALTHAANAVHSIYVFSLPAGPIWALHVFYLPVTALMLALSLACTAKSRGTKPKVGSLEAGRF